VIVSDESAVPPGSIVSTPVSLVPLPQAHPYEESRTLSNQHGNSMLKNPHVDTFSALSNPIYSADDCSNIYQTISSGENDYEDLDENFNGRGSCAPVPYEVPVEAGAGGKGKASIRRKSVVNAECDVIIENRNAVDSALESEQEKYNRTSHSQAIAKVRNNQLIDASTIFCPSCRWRWISIHKDTLLCISTTTRF
jgi:hypothetical protein